MIITITVSITTVTILLMSATITTMTTTHLTKGAVASLRVRAAVQ